MTAHRLILYKYNFGIWLFRVFTIYGLVCLGWGLRNNQTISDPGAGFESECMNAFRSCIYVSYCYIFPLNPLGKGSGTPFPVPLPGYSSHVIAD